MQNDLKCCGVKSYEDWLRIPESDGDIPDSCGDRPEPQRRPGCLDEIAESFKNNECYVGVVALLVALVQLIGILFSCCLADKGKRAEGRAPQQKLAKLNQPLKREIYH